MSRQQPRSPASEVKLDSTLQIRDHSLDHSTQRAGEREVGVPSRVERKSGTASIEARDAKPTNNHRRY